MPLSIVVTMLGQTGYRRFKKRPKMHHMAAGYGSEDRRLSPGIR